MCQTVEPRFCRVLPLLGEVVQVLFHPAVQRVKSFYVQRVQHLRLQDSEQDPVAG